MVGLERSIPNNIGTFTGTNAHILINLGIVSPESGKIAEFLMLIALYKLLNSYLSKINGFPYYCSLSLYALIVHTL
jgi:hypothetical protein